MDALLLLGIGVVCGLGIAALAIRNERNAVTIQRIIATIRSGDSSSAKTPEPTTSATLPQQPINPPMKHPDMDAVLAKLEAVIQQRDAITKERDALAVELTQEREKLRIANARIAELDPPKRRLFGNASQGGAKAV